MGISNRNHSGKVVPAGGVGSPKGNHPSEPAPASQHHSKQPPRAFRDVPTAQLRAVLAYQEAHPDTAAPDEQAAQIARYRAELRRRESEEAV